MQVEPQAALVFVALRGGRRPRPLGYLEQITKVRLEIGYLLKQIKSTAFFGYLIKTHDVPLVPLLKRKGHLLKNNTLVLRNYLYLCKKKTT